MAPSHFLVVRDESSTPFTPTILKLLIALLVIVAIGLLLVGALFCLRHVRRAQKDSQLPMYNDIHEKGVSDHRRLTITTSAKRPQSVCIYQEKSDSTSPPQSPIPEIRITFPEEVDESGKTHSGRVLIVRVGEHSIGLEPMQEELPPYQKDHSDRFHSLDLERIGGLKEKEQHWS